MHFHFAQSYPVSHASWLVVQTHPRREKEAIANLRRQNFNVYCPMLVQRIRHARRTRDASRPMFPSYVFVEYNPAQRWRPILSTYAVRSVVRQGAKPSLLNGAFIEEMKWREQNGVITKPSSPYGVGQKIKLERGPLTGLVGKIIELRDNERMLVLMNLLNQKVRVQVDSNMQSMTVM
ncbi:MAG: transcription termination/antitermination protein NusG [Hyphomicrobiaceae bacterium]